METQQPMNGDPNKSLEVGVVLENKWVILDFIGKGGMGEVYRAHQLNLDRDVAIKIISQKWLEEINDNDYEAETCVERFLREVKVMAQVRHPDVIQIFDYGTTSIGKGGQDLVIEYIAMEYIPGGTLRSTMSAEGYYPDEERTREWLTLYFLPILDGVCALHEKGIVHRDLKPENVLLDGKTPKIADFGLARSCRLGPVTESMDIKGTPPYMSPEHFMDLKRTDERADVYSLGKILYEALSGKMKQDQIPFRKASLAEPETPFFQDLDRIIQEATNEDKRERLPSVKSFRQTILDTLETEIKPSPPEAEKAPVLKHKRWKTLVAAPLLLLIGLGIYLFHEESHVSAPSSHSVSPGITQEKTQEKGSEHGAPPPPGVKGQDQDIMRLIPGGTITLPPSFGPDAGRTIQVESFYLDETLVTNYQYVEFLNRVLSKIKVEDGVVWGDGKVWLMLGEVKGGYEPIVFEDGKFRLQLSAYSSHPVLRVSAQGASAYVQFHGSRLITEDEWLYAVITGKRAVSSESTLQRPVPSASDENAAPSPVLIYQPDAYGIRGMNGSVGEWGVRAWKTSFEGDNKTQDYIVLGACAGSREIGIQGPSPSAVARRPWEASEEVGFRCARSTTPESG
ncbi:MAG TPA: bifunctional serine/threonine-protein kinase/formylglycine-generating enzyme family protein [Syntrophobacteraceae bacterium]|nr:bifunctional serine/threonine-protein kinase/formylglycine-generating enzyme family protein [Syntrophobacteraceae bacterium]